MSMCESHLISFLSSLYFRRPLCFNLQAVDYFNLVVGHILPISKINSNFPKMPPCFLLNLHTSQVVEVEVAILNTKTVVAAVAVAFPMIEVVVVAKATSNVATAIIPAEAVVQILASSLKDLHNTRAILRRHPHHPKHSIMRIIITMEEEVPNSNLEVEAGLPWMVVTLKSTKTMASLTLPQFHRPRLTLTYSSLSS